MVAYSQESFLRSLHAIHGSNGNGGNNGGETPATNTDSSDLPLPQANKSAYNRRPSVGHGSKQQQQQQQSQQSRRRASMCESMPNLGVTMMPLPRLPFESDGTTISSRGAMSRRARNTSIASNDDFAMTTSFEKVIRRKDHTVTKNSSSINNSSATTSSSHSPTKPNVSIQLRRKSCASSSSNSTSIHSGGSNTVKPERPESPNPILLSPQRKPQFAFAASFEKQIKNKGTSVASSVQQSQQQQQQPESIFKGSSKQRHRRRGSAISAVSFTGSRSGSTVATQATSTVTATCSPTSSTPHNNNSTKMSSSRGGSKVSNVVPLPPPPPRGDHGNSNNSNNNNISKFYRPSSHGGNNGSSFHNSSPTLVSRMTTSTASTTTTPPSNSSSTKHIFIAKSSPGRSVPKPPFTPSSQNYFHGQQQREKDNDNNIDDDDDDDANPAHGEKDAPLSSSSSNNNNNNQTTKVKNVPWINESNGRHGVYSGHIITNSNDGTMNPHGYGTFVDNFTKKQIVGMWSHGKLKSHDLNRHQTAAAEKEADDAAGRLSPREVSIVPDAMTTAPSTATARSTVTGSSSIKNNKKGFARSLSNGTSNSNDPASGGGGGGGTTRQRPPPPTRRHSIHDVTEETRDNNTGNSFPLPQKQQNNTQPSLHSRGVLANASLAQQQQQQQQQQRQKHSPHHQAAQALTEAVSRLQHHHPKQTPPTSSATTPHHSKQISKPTPPPPPSKATATTSLPIRVEAPRRHSDGMKDEVIRQHVHRQQQRRRCSVVDVPTKSTTVPSIEKDEAPTLPLQEQQQQQQQQQEEEEKHRGFRKDYALGEQARSPTHMTIESTKESSFQSACALQSHDFAFVKRSDGKWTYAIMAYRSFEPVNGDKTKSPKQEGNGEEEKEALEECMMFVMSDTGSTKMIKKKQWGEFVRRVSMEGAKRNHDWKETKVDGFMVPPSIREDEEAEVKPYVVKLDKATRGNDENPYVVHDEHYWVPKSLSIPSHFNDEFSIISNVSMVK